MDPVTAKLMSAAGAAAEEHIYVDDVFQTYLHEGQDSSSTINNGIDLSGEGGLVWVKNRDTSGYGHFLFDTERGATKATTSHSTSATVTEPKGVTAFNSNGFNIGGTYGDNAFNKSGIDYVYWTFRQCPGFFDVVTYTGDGTNSRAISHNLGHNVRAVFIKNVTNTGDFAGCYLQGASLWTGESYTGMYLNKTQGKGGTTANGLGVSAISTTTFTVNASGNSTTLEFVPNASGNEYVAYVFSDQAAFGDNDDEKILEVGTYTGTGTTGHFESVGFEPQFVLLKRTDSDSNWLMLDSMRGVTSNSADDIILNANQNDNETNCKFNAMHFNATGFTLDSAGGAVNGNGGNYWYMAIRRPHKPPSAGTDVFHADAGTNNSSSGVITTGFPVDFSMFGYRTDGGTYAVNSRLTGYPTSATATSGWGDQLATSSTGAESTGSYPTYHSPDNTTIKRGGNGHNANGVSGFFFKRAPGFFDVVTYTGTGSAQTVNHNLGVAPELMIVKQRDGGSYWAVYSSALGATKYLSLASSNAENSSVAVWNNTSPTSSVFTVNYAGAVNNSGSQYIAFLFASLSGISKIGTYSGTGSNIDIDCGFTGGARFVLIKRTDSSGDWYVWDTVRGIVSGNDPHLFLNKTDPEVTNTDYIDPLNAGFTVTSSAPAALNANGGTYIFLAIA